jgi:hypothetical protein
MPNTTTLDLEPEAEASIALPKSVVQSGYKAKYAAREAAMQRRPKGVARKALARSTGDWLAVELAKRVLDDKAKIDVPRLEALLDANGVKHSHYNRTTKGWQGRLRMSGGLALRTIVANEEALLLPGGERLEAPKSWCAKYQR